MRFGQMGKFFGEMGEDKPKSSGGPPPPPVDGIITETGIQIDSEAGVDLVHE